MQALELAKIEAKAFMTMQAEGEPCVAAFRLWLTLPLERQAIVSAVLKILTEVPTLACGFDAEGELSIPLLDDRNIAEQCVQSVDQADELQAVRAQFDVFELPSFRVVHDADSLLLLTHHAGFDGYATGRLFGLLLHFLYGEGAAPVDLPSAQTERQLDLAWMKRYRAVVREWPIAGPALPDSGQHYLHTHTFSTRALHQAAKHVSQATQVPLTINDLICAAAHRVIGAERSGTLLTFTGCDNRPMLANPTVFGNQSTMLTLASSEQDRQGTFELAVSLCRQRMDLMDHGIEATLVLSGLKERRRVDALITAPVADLTLVERNVRRWSAVAAAQSYYGRRGIVFGVVGEQAQLVAHTTEARDVAALINAELRRHFHYTAE